MLPALAHQETTTGAPIDSALWGQEGELWTPQSRLPDFSFAGYHRGEDDLPMLPVTHNVRDFFAVGDGKTDDTAAFKRAIATVRSGVILIPKGKYRITDILEIRKPNIVLRGESRDETVLLFPRPLNDVRPNWSSTARGRRTSIYSWSGGFVWVKGNYQTEVITPVVSPASRGSNAIRVSDINDLEVGQEIELRQRDDANNSLAQYLYSEDPGEVEALRGRTKTSFTARIISIRGTSITLDRPIRTDLRLAWRPRVHRFAPTVTEVGIENITFEFPDNSYAGHFSEMGMNPVCMEQVAHCWMRDVRVLNCDSGPIIEARFCTIDGLVLESTRRPDAGMQTTGHHGVILGGEDNLFRGFDFLTRFQHDITLGAEAAGNVVADGQGLDLCFDHHRSAPYENLWTNIDVGAGTDVWRNGGGEALGRPAAARNTFWNIRAKRRLPLPPTGFGPAELNFVGFYAERRNTATSIAEGLWFEAIDPLALRIPNLHFAQRNLRLRRR